MEKKNFVFKYSLVRWQMEMAWQLSIKKKAEDFAKFGPSVQFARNC
jgi:hypothetical protein